MKMDWFFSRQHTGTGDFHNQVQETVRSLMEEAKGSVDFIKCNVVLTEETGIQEVVNVLRQELHGDMPVMTFLLQESLGGDSEIAIDAIGVFRHPELKVERFSLQGNEAYPEAVKAGEYVFAGMQMPATHSDMESEARESIERLLEVFRFAGCKKEQVVRNLIYLTDCSQFDDYNNVYREFFRKGYNPPARSLMGVKRTPGDYRMGVEGVAYLGSRRVELAAERAAASPAPYSLGVLAGQLIFISGQVGLKQGKLAKPVAEEMRQAFRNLEEVLDTMEAGSWRAAKASGYAVNAEAEAEVASASEEYFGKIPCTTYRVHGLARLIYSVEADVIALACSNEREERNV